MTDSVRRTYWLIGFFGLAGFVVYVAATGIRDGLAFALGAAGSFGNFWLFDRLSRRIAPGGATAGKPWEAGAFIGRYIILLGIGYAIVETLNVSPLAVILGLFASTAAVLASFAIELFNHITRKRITH
ncbi:MAG TPA: hypothetical protein VKX25_09785 [Bryobacteraceae bacterium]|jgi:hypothetical protein|nr:hypothetical protein [Bryobacteraceae bacterium]